MPLNLTVSLHATDDVSRARTMPVAKAYKIADILKACDYYFKKTGRRYYFEYTLIAGILLDFDKEKWARCKMRPEKNTSAGPERGWPMCLFAVELNCS